MSQKPLGTAILLRCVLLALLIASAHGSFADNPNQKLKKVGKDKVPDQYIVVLEDDLSDRVSEAVAQVANAHGVHVEKIWSDVINGFFTTMTESQALALSQHPFVKYVEENAAWYVSASQRTNIDPQICDPTTTPNCGAVVDNRLWHLDRIDQNSAVPNETYGYCTDGSGRTVYVVDGGVNKFHNEFGPGGARVLPGFNATPDSMPADDPCLGFAEPAMGPKANLEAIDYRNELLSSGHGTAVASAVGGRRVGVAKNVTIVPIKVIRLRCRDAQCLSRSR